GLFLLIGALCAPEAAAAATGEDPALQWARDADYDPAVPTPASLLGHPLGERPASVQQLLAYARLLAEASDRVSVQEIGRSVEGDPLLLLAISASKDLEGLLQSRTALDFSTSVKAQTSGAQAPLPAVWVACGIHGDEASGCDAGMFLAYHLAADRSEQTQELLEHLVVLIDLCQNPDGRRRFLQHLRSFTRQVGGPDPHPEAIEHTQLWPTGRYNHNFFDLNRDWAFLTQPETRARVAAFLNWRPQVFLDLHEMRSSSTYFFPPSALPHNPLLPQELQSWLELYGKANANAFDAAGVDYFVREQFDLFYPGYGDSWPSLQGAIGMTFEQGSSDGLRIEDGSGAIRSYRDAVQHHFLAAVTSCRTSAAKSRELLQYSRRFHDEALRRADKADAKEILFDLGQAPAEARRLARLLSMQGVQVLRSERGFEARVSTQESGEENKHEFPAGSYRIVLRQAAYPLLQNLLGWDQPMDEGFLKDETERHRAGLRDRFYDVTAWSLPLAFGLTTYYSAKNLDVASVRVKTEKIPSSPALDPAKASYGYLIPDRDNASCAALAALWREGARVYLARVAFKRGEESFPAGSLVLKRSVQDSTLALDSLLEKVARDTGVEVVPVSSAWSDEGPSLGSDAVLRLRQPRIVVAGGPGVRPTSLGSVLWVLQEHMGVDCSTVLLDQLDELRLREVDVIVIPDLQKHAPLLPDLRSWVDQGGTLVALGRASEALMDLPGWLSASLEDGAQPEGNESAPALEAEPEGETSPYPNEEDASSPPAGEGSAEARHAGGKPSDSPPSIPGAIFRLERAPYHFLCYGVRRPICALVQQGRQLRAGEQDQTVVNYAEHEPLIAGFAWPETVQALAGAPYLICEEHEKGRVVLFAEDPSFRGIWPVTTRLLLNAVLLAPSLPR
ncbi:MAG TPA: M14 family metallopeptidase, partial [Candidatus Krumholzibacteria bacterium]|nr:M14 family metallopeptidase [Candidatus Krumholzibacteria bacterium]